MTATSMDGTMRGARASIDPQGLSEFEQHRRYLTGLAYRMLGSLTEAEDAVQEGYIRWHRTNRSEVDCARAFLSKTVARICLDQMRSARVRRETYVGPWLPEPVLEAGTLSADTASEYAADLSVGLMLALERLSPLERAAFLLHDVFDVGFEEVARLLDRSEVACRQLATRAREHVRSQRPRFDVTPEKGDEILQAFMGAYRSGDVGALARVLAEDAVLLADGGGKRRTALNPIVGRDKILRLFEGGTRKRHEKPVVLATSTVNGLPGCVISFDDGSLQTIALEIVGDVIKTIYTVRNPDKLRHIPGPAAART